METTRNKLTKDTKIFFDDLSKYVGCKLYFYGSIQRSDYFPGSSDIDVDIFTENIDSTISRMQHFLHVKKNSFKKVVWRLNHNNQMVYGYKIMYSNLDLNLTCEFSIYDYKYKEGVLFQHKKKITIPYYASVMLIIVKVLFYHLNFISLDSYRYLKNIILTKYIGLPDDQFVAFKSFF